jgi:hypothetical protein
MKPLPKTSALITAPPPMPSADAHHQAVMAAL